MTIEYKGAAVYVPIIIKETGPKDQGSWRGSRTKFTLELVPATDPMEDKVVYTIKRTRTMGQRVMVGPEINQDPECKSKRIRWYDQNALKPTNRYHW